MKTNKLKKSFFLGLAALLAAGISSCADEAKEMGGAKPLDSDQSFFVNININSTDAMTRADKIADYGDGEEAYQPDREPNFSDGIEIENKVQTIFLVFYDEKGQRVATTQVRKENGMNPETTAPYPGNNASENSLYQGVVQIDIKHGSLPPKYVMCFINPISSSNFDINPDFASLEALQKVTRDRIIDDTGLFAMSKSVYYGPNRSKEGYNESWNDDPATYFEKIVATPIAEGELFDNLQEARNALDGNDKEGKPLDKKKVLDIYVERYAAKVNFSIASDAIKGINVGGKTLEFVPEYWAVNAYESLTYACKSFFGYNEDGTLNMEENLKFSQLQDAFGGEKAWYWNSPKYHRCYWAQTPAYYSANYPRVADDIKDKGSFATNHYALGYYSYNDMVENAKGNLIDKARKVTLGETTTIYARENTVQGAALHKAADDPLASPRAAIASVALVGHYEIRGKELLKDFYVMGNATNGYTLFEEEDEALAYLINSGVRFATNQEGNTSFFDYSIDGFGFNQHTEVEKYKSFFTIKHPEYPTRTYGFENDAENALVIDSRFVTVQLKTEALSALEDYPLYAYIDGKYQQVTEENFDQVNQQMLYQSGTIQAFLGGKAYFTIPIKHLGFYRKDNENAGKNANDKGFKWDAVMSGDFGLVRNHVYTITVDKIEGLGNGIPDPSDPIVPPTDPEEYFIGARIIVLNWAVVPTQHETL